MIEKNMSTRLINIKERIIVPTRFFSCELIHNKKIDNIPYKKPKSYVSNNTHPSIRKSIEIIKQGYIFFDCLIFKNIEVTKNNFTNSIV